MFVIIVVTTVTWKVHFLHYIKDMTINMVELFRFQTGSWRQADRSSHHLVMLQPVVFFTSTPGWDRTSSRSITNPPNCSGTILMT